MLFVQLHCCLKGTTSWREAQDLGFDTRTDRQLCTNSLVVLVTRTLYHLILPQLCLVIVRCVQAGPLNCVRRELKPAC